MNNNPWLLIDVSNLAHRSIHVMRDLEYGGEGTGAVYGVLRTSMDLCDLFGTARIAFCFDGGCDARTKIFPDYKADRRRKRSEMGEEEIETRRSLRRQIYRLRTQYLPDAGFRNVLMADGYEADDVIASICLSAFEGSKTPKDEFIIVSSDRDMYQLLGPHTSLWTPHGRMVTEQSLREEYGIGPGAWAHVKAIAGSKDGIPGVSGVGNRTAAKFLAGGLKESTKTFQKIVQATELINRNLELTRLPARGCPRFDLEEDEIKEKDWLDVLSKLGIRSLSDRIPGVKNERTRA